MPPTIGSGAMTMTAPLTGSLSTFCNWVRPNLPAPSRKLWAGKIGSKPPAPPASMPTVSTPKPLIEALAAIQRAPATDTPGVCDPESSTLRKDAVSADRALHPVFRMTQALSAFAAVWAVLSMTTIGPISRAGGI